jgi:DNA adenine methylase
MDGKLTPAPPARPPAPYMGGKRHLAERIVARLAAIPHITHVEVFLGMGGVFLRRPYRAKAEVVNDISADVANLFRILQRHYVPFMETLRWQLTSRAEFERLVAAVPDTLTDLERAARFLYLQRTAYGGKVVGRNFGVSPAVPGRFDVTKLGALLEEVHERLAGVVIERLPWADLVERYDRPDTLFYLDPPYWGGEEDYGAGVFRRDEFEALAGVLAGLKGRFLLSINDTTETRRIFGSFVIEEVKVPYGMARGEIMPELLVSGEVIPDLLTHVQGR